jgi:hypothetical protein
MHHRHVETTFLFKHVALTNMFLSTMYIYIYICIYIYVSIYIFMYIYIYAQDIALLGIQTALLAYEYI